MSDTFALCMSLVTDTWRLSMPMEKSVVATMVMGAFLPSHDLRRPLQRGRIDAGRSRGAEPLTVTTAETEGGATRRMSRPARDSGAARVGAGVAGCTYVEENLGVRGRRTVVMIPPRMILVASVAPVGPRPVVRSCVVEVSAGGARV